MIGTLEEVAMPQNGIYHVGIAALCEAFTHNKNLQIINLNDNTVTEKGALAISKVMPQLQNLKEINLGDCLLKTKGAILLADCLKDSHVKLQQIILSHNEIRIEGGIKLIKAMSNKSVLQTVNLNGNQFGEKGQNDLKNELKSVGKLNTLGSLSEDESEDEEQDDDDEVVSSESEEEVLTEVTVEDFLDNPSAENFLNLGDSRSELILKASKVSFLISSVT